MARVLVANWADVTSFECEREDPSLECVEDLATPQLMGACLVHTLEPPAWWLEALRQEVEDDLDERMQGETDPLLLKPHREWKVDAWHEPSGQDRDRGRPGMSMDLAEDGEFVATVVIHAVELANELNRGEVR